MDGIAQIDGTRRRGRHQPMAGNRNARIANFEEMEVLVDVNEMTLSASNSAIRLPLK